MRIHTLTSMEKLWFKSRLVGGSWGQPPPPQPPAAKFRAISSKLRELFQPYLRKFPRKSPKSSQPTRAVWHRARSRSSASLAPHLGLCIHPSRSRSRWFPAWPAAAWRRRWRPSTPTDFGRFHLGVQFSPLRRARAL